MNHSASEFERRATFADAVERLFRARPGAWIPVSDLAQAGGFCAWRTRIADVRKRFEEAGIGTIEWNGHTKTSAYRWVRAAAQPITQPELFR